MKPTRVAWIISFVSLAILAARTAPAHADDDPSLQRLAAMSADGQHVAIYSDNPGDDHDAKSSLAVLAADGTLEQRISVEPTNPDRARFDAALAKINKLFADGSYKRMSRVTVVVTLPMTHKTDLATRLTSGNVELLVRIAAGKLIVSARRAGKTLAPITRALPTTVAPCPAVDAYTFSNTTAGYDPATGRLAFSIAAWHGDAVCSSHDFVVTLG